MARDSALEAPLNIVLFVDFDVSCSRPLYAQCILRGLRDLGHHIALFVYSHEKPILLLEEPQPNIVPRHESPSVVLQTRLRRADAVLVITPRTVHQLSFPLFQFQIGERFFDGHTYSWYTNGMSCVLLGGWINKREVAIKLRAILATSDFPNMSRGVLPGPAYLKEFYTEDHSVETPGPCV